MNTTKLINAYVAANWADYTPADCDVLPVGDLGDLPYGGADAGGRVGDWVVLSKDHQAAEVVRIIDGAVQSIHTLP